MADQETPDKNEAQELADLALSRAPELEDFPFSQLFMDEERFLRILRRSGRPGVREQRAIFMMGRALIEQAIEIRKSIDALVNTVAARHVIESTEAARRMAVQPPKTPKPKPKVKPDTGNKKPVRRVRRKA
jgi:hypothetical protein